MLDYTKIRFWWSGLAGRKVSSNRYEKIYDMGPRAATGDATFATAATRPIVDELSDWYGLAVDPAASNLVRFSEDFGSATWGISVGLIKTASAIVAPDDTLTAWTIANTTGAGSLGTSHTMTAFTGNGTKAISLYVYPGTAPFSEIALYDNTALNTLARLRITWATYAVSLIAGAGAVRMYKVKNGWFRIILEANSVVAANSNQFFVYPCGTPSGQIGNVHVWGAQGENGNIATQYKKTTGTAVTTSALVAPITDAIPVTGTIILWDSMLNAYASGPLENEVFDSENLSTTFVSLHKDETDQSQVKVRVHNNTEVASANLQWQPTNQRKRWFFAMTYNGSTVQVYRGDVQGNISKIIDSAYTPTTAAIRDMFLHTTAAGAGAVGASYLDILTYDDVLTQADIEAIFYGNVPIFQQTAYAGTFVDKFRQKVQAEPGSTYVTTLEATVLATWSTEL